LAINKEELKHRPNQPTPSLTAEGEHAKEYTTKSNRPQALGEPIDAFLEHAMGMIQSAFMTSQHAHYANFPDDPLDRVIM
jgi:hypothetical protein